MTRNFEEDDDFDGETRVEEDTFILPLPCGLVVVSSNVQCKTLLAINVIPSFAPGTSGDRKLYNKNLCNADSAAPVILADTSLPDIALQKGVMYHTKSG